MRTALTEADSAFRLLVCPPRPLAFDGHPISGLPDRMLALDELRDLLMAPRLSPEVSDAVWRQLIGHTRDWDPAWVVGAVGVALPGLTRIASRLSRGYAKVADDIDSEVLAGFLQALRADTLDAPRVWLRLCWAAWRSGLRARRLEDTLELPPDMPTGSATPRRPYGHPDLVLGRAVAAGIITAEQADLIGATRVGDVLVEQLAAEQGQTASVIRMRRKRAERKLVAALQGGQVSGVVLDATFVGNRAVQARRNGVFSLPPRGEGGATRRLTCGVGANGALPPRDLELARLERAIPAASPRSPKTSTARSSAATPPGTCCVTPASRYE